MLYTLLAMLLTALCVTGTDKLMASSAVLDTVCAFNLVRLEYFRRYNKLVNLRIKQN